MQGGPPMALEWGGRIPPKPPLMMQGANYSPRMGGGSPQTPLMTQGQQTPQKRPFHTVKPRKVQISCLFHGQALTDWSGSKDKCSWTCPQPPPKISLRPKQPLLTSGLDKGKKGGNPTFSVNRKKDPITEVFCFSTYPTHIGTMHCHICPQQTLKRWGW